MRTDLNLCPNIHIVEAELMDGTCPLYGDVFECLLSFT